MIIQCKTKERKAENNYLFKKENIRSYFYPFVLFNKSLIRKIGKEENLT